MLCGRQIDMKLSMLMRSIDGTYKAAEEEARWPLCVGLRVEIGAKKREKRRKDCLSVRVLFLW